MLPYISTPIGIVEMFPIMAAIGAVAFVYVLHIKLTKAENPSEEEIYILPKVVYSGMIALAFAAIFDTLFKIKELSTPVFSGITFYGGLVGAIIGIFVQLHLSKSHTQYCVAEWFNILTQPFITFHIFGRIGCFFGGCCYGKTTDSVIGVYFPDNESVNIFHNGEKCFPTQLFEAFVLLIILIIVAKSKTKFKTYITSYAIARFFIEFFRGDDRGNLFVYLSPAQVFSIVILLILSVHTLFHRSKHK